VDELRPRVKNFELTLDAVIDIQFCQNLFDKWTAELDKVSSDAKKQDDREQTLRFYLGRLKERGGVCSQEAHEILQHHVRFASLMAQRIDDASKSQDNLISDSPEARDLAKDISKASGLLSTNVDRMTYELDSFVNALKNIQVTAATVAREKSLVERILQWLKSMFKAIATIFATLTPSISAIVRHHPDPKVRGCALSNTTLGQAASVFCKAGSEPKNGKESESLDSVILFLKGVVPNEVESAQRKLKRLDKVLELLERMKAGQRMAIGDSDPAAVAEEWRNVAEQYRMAVSAWDNQPPPEYNSPPGIDNPLSVKRIENDSAPIGRSRTLDSSMVSVSRTISPATHSRQSSSPTSAGSPFHSQAERNPLGPGSYETEHAAVFRKPLVQREGVGRAVAQFDFRGVQQGDLSFSKGQVITVTEKSDSTETWWKGKLEGREGLFPANFVKLI
jgi:hypothetical protein